MAAAAAISLYLGPGLHVVRDAVGRYEPDRPILGQIIDQSARWTSASRASSVASQSIPLREHASLASTVLGLGKSQIARILGVSRMTLYDWIKGEIEPQGRNAVRLASLGRLTTEISRDTERPLYHRFVETPLEGEPSSILELLLQDEWDEQQLLALLQRARDLTAERDRRIGASARAPQPPRTQQEAILTDNLTALGAG